MYGRPYFFAADATGGPERPDRTATFKPPAEDGARRAAVSDVATDIPMDGILPVRHGRCDRDTCWNS